MTLIAHWRNFQAKPGEEWNYKRAYDARRYHTNHTASYGANLEEKLLATNQTHMLKVGGIYFRFLWDDGGGSVLA